MHQNTRLTYLGFGSLLLTVLASQLAYTEATTSGIDILLVGITLISVSVFLGVAITIMRNNQTSIPIRVMR